MPTGPGATWQHGRIPRFDDILKRKKKAPKVIRGLCSFIAADAQGGHYGGTVMGLVVATADQ
jgi:hypothetical protein